MHVRPSLDVLPSAGGLLDRAPTGGLRLDLLVGGLGGRVLEHLRIRRALAQLGEGIAEHRPERGDDPRLPRLLLGQALLLFDLSLVLEVLDERHRGVEGVEELADGTARLPRLLLGDRDERPGAGPAHGVALEILEPDASLQVLRENLERRQQCLLLLDLGLTAIDRTHDLLVRHFRPPFSFFEPITQFREPLWRYGQNGMKIVRLYRLP